MRSIKDVIEKKKFNNNSSNRINSLWEEADQFGKYIGVPTKIVLRAFKLYGKEKVLSLRAFLKDYPTDYRGKVGIFFWACKNIGLDKKKEQITTGL